MKKTLLALAFILWPALAFAQCNGVFPANTLCGNLGASPAPPAAFTASGTVVGPGSSTLHGLSTWANTGGTQLEDTATILPTIPGNYAWGGNQSFTGTDAHSGANTFSNTVQFSGTGIEIGSATGGFLGTGKSNASDTSGFGFYVNGNRATRIVATATVNFYVGGTGNSDSNDCLSPTVSGGHGPCATIIHAWNVTLTNYDFNSNACIINVAAGTYNQTSNTAIFQNRQVGTHFCTISGAGSGSTTVTNPDSPDGSDTFFITDEAGVVLTGMTISNGTAGGADIHGSQGFGADVGPDIILGATTGPRIRIGTNFFAAVHSISQSGNAAAFGQVSGAGASLDVSQATINTPSNVTYSSATFISADGGVILVPPLASWTGGGTITGTKYIVNCASIDPGGGLDLNSVIPGTVNGSISFCPYGTISTAPVTFPGAGLFSQNVTISGVLGTAPATWTDTQTCTTGQIAVDSNFIYVCTAANTVKRAALSSF